jgi:hypothetical protein
VKIRSLPVILNQSIGQPIAAKMPVSKAAAFAAGLGLSMLSYPFHATPTSSGDTVQGLYDALLCTAEHWVKAVVSCNWSRLFAAASTSPRWRGYRSARPGPI